MKKDEYNMTVLIICFVSPFLAPNTGIALPLNGFSTATTEKPFIDDVGNGQQSSYSEQTFTLPGRMTYYESSG